MGSYLFCPLSYYHSSSFVLNIEPVHAFPNNITASRLTSDLTHWRNNRDNNIYKYGIALTNMAAVNSCLPETIYNARSSCENWFGVHYQVWST